MFELSPPSQPGGSWTEALLYSFQGWPDGFFPASGLVFGSQGELYGTTTLGGSFACGPGCGAIFQLTPPSQPDGAWTKSDIYQFSGNNGANPLGNLIVDTSGNLYGTTQYGGPSYCHVGGDFGCGLVFELSPPSQPGNPWTESILYEFREPVTGDGHDPSSGVIMDGSGDLFGTTLRGGESDAGTVFELTPPAQTGGLWVKRQFGLGTVVGGSIDPYAGLAFGPERAVTMTGIAGSSGAVFSLGL